MKMGSNVEVKANEIDERQNNDLTLVMGALGFIIVAFFTKQIFFSSPERMKGEYSLTLDGLNNSSVDVVKPTVKHPQITTEPVVSTSAAETPAPASTKPAMPYTPSSIIPGSGVATNQQIVYRSTLGQRDNEATPNQVIYSSTASVPVRAPVSVAAKGVGALTGFAADRNEVFGAQISGQPFSNITNEEATTLNAEDQIRNRLGFLVPGESYVPSTNL